MGRSRAARKVLRARLSSLLFGGAAASRTLIAIPYHDDRNSPRTRKASLSRASALEYGRKEQLTQNGHIGQFIFYTRNSACRQQQLCNFPPPNAPTRRRRPTSTSSFFPENAAGKPATLSGCQF